MDFNKLRVFEGEYWDIFLHRDQTCLGRVYFWYKGTESDLLDVSKDALGEFIDIGKRIKKSLVSNFKPDMFNYESLNNETKHLHIHLIPRYSRKIKLFGLVFHDIKYGHGYETNPDFAVDESGLVKIVNMIKEKI